MENKLAASELTLAKDGSLYHIHLKPHQLYDHIILVGDPQRVEMVSNHFDSIDFKTSNREIFAHSGKLNGVGVTVLSTGMGVDNIDIVLTELDACANIDLQSREFNPKHRNLNLIRLGTCGSLQKEAGCGKYVVSKYVVGIDGIMYFYKNNEGVIDERLTQSFISFMNWDSSLPKPYGVECSETLLKKIGFDMLEGITITAPGFYGPQGRQIRLPIAFSEINNKLSDFSFNGCKATNYEMETSSLYALGKNLGHDCLTICLVIANRVEGRFLETYNKEMEDLIEKVLRRLCF